MTVSSLYKKSDLSRLVGSSGGLLRFEQPRDNAVFPKNTCTGHISVNDVLHNKQQGHGTDRSNFPLKISVATSQSNLRGLGSNPIMENPKSRCLTTSKVFGKGGPDNDAQPIPACVDSTSKSGPSFISSPSLTNEQNLGKESDASRYNNSRKGVILERDAVASNIELRLGQPCQQNWTLRNSVLPVMGPQILDALGDPQRSNFPEQLIHNSTLNNVHTKLVIVSFILSTRSSFSCVLNDLFSEQLVFDFLFFIFLCSNQFQFDRGMQTISSVCCGYI